MATLAMSLAQNRKTLPVEGCAVSARSRCGYWFSGDVWGR